MKNIILLFVYICISLEFNYAQIDYQGILKLNSSNEVVTTYDWTDPNVVYWNSSVKSNGLGIRPFNLATLPIEIFSNSQDVVNQTNSIITEWNSNGCINLFENHFFPSILLAFENDNQFFPDIDIIGRALSAVVTENNKFVFTEYSANTLTDFEQTAVILNNTDDFPYQWSTELSNQGSNIIPFKPILMHEMGHLIGLGHNIPDWGDHSIMQFPQAIGNLLFSLSTYDITGLQSLCSFNGTPTGIEDAILIYQYQSTISPNTYNSGFSASFIDEYPYGNYLIDGIHWKLNALHANGQLEISGGPQYFSNLPNNYCWQRDLNGNVIGIVTAYGTDNDGVFHESTVNVGITNVPLNTTSGSLSNNETWCGSITITGDVTVPSGITLTILPGANLVFQNNSSLIISGNLISNGISYSKTTFDFISQNSSYQNGIKVNPGGSITISHSILKNAYRGIYFNEAYGSIDNCEFYNSYSGIHLYRTNYTTEDPHISNNYSHDNQFGIVMYYSSPYLTGNEFNNNWRGVGCTDYSSAYLGYAGSFGNNYIHNNQIGVFAYGYSNPFLGRSTCTIQGGNNRIENNSYKELYTHTYCTIIAENNWWGNNPPISSQFYVASNSSLDYNPWLMSVPQYRQLTNRENSPEELLYNEKLAPGNNTEASNEINIDAELILTENQELENEIKSSFNSQWPIYWKLLYARNLIDVKKYKFAQKICRDIIIDHPDSTLSYYALDLLWRASRRYDKDSLTIFLNNISNAQIKKSLFSAAELMLAGFDKTNILRNLARMLRKYKKEPIVEFILFQKFLYYYYDENDLVQARLAAIELAQLFPESESTLDALRHLEGSTFNLGKNSLILENQVKLNTIDKPLDYELFGNYPNPFNPTTTISYALPYDSQVEISIYDIMGRVIKDFFYNSISSGYQKTVWDGKSENGTQVASGIYIYRIKAKSMENQTEIFETSSKLILMK